MGDEVRWMTQVAGIVVDRRSSVTVLTNGGQIAYRDVAASLGSDRPVVVLAGSGGTADAIAQARAGNGDDNRAVKIAASPLTTVAEVGERAWPPPSIETALVGGCDVPVASIVPLAGRRACRRRRTGVSASSRRWVRAECAGRAVERQRLTTPV
jgi:hypothetical protein